MKYFNSFAYRFHLIVVMGIGLLCCNCTTTNNTSLNKNNLQDQTSLYLLQHANNPVYWQPWDSELYKTQNSDAKLLLVSVGYSSCHWCHVMEKETFKDKAVASLMNQHFVNIKIDREEHPDVDKIYMTALQLMTGSGGWPLNVICLPDGRPVYAGSYHTQSQWIDVLTKIQSIYEESPEKLYTLADSVAKGIRSANTISAPQESKDFDKKLFDSPMNQWEKRLDFDYGGEKQEQKFINPVKLNFLNEYQAVSKHPKLREYIDLSLLKIATGGIYDPIDGGVFRYTIDSKWEKPHFEKMLYDNAQCIALYAEAYKQHPEPLYKEVIDETIAFLRQKMQDPEGGFFAAIDADNKQGEGRYYTISKSELSTLSKDTISLFHAYYNIQTNNPFKDDLYTLKKGCSDEEFMKKHTLSREEFDALKASWRDAIEKLVDTRDHPQIDKKIITSWNALTIIGLAKASQALDNKTYLTEAENLFTFIIENLFISGTLYHTLQNKIPKVKAFLDDNATMAEASLLLYKTTGKTEYLDWSQKFSEIILKNYHTDESSLFTYKMANPLLTDIIEINDDVIPSANAQIAHTLYDLGELLQEERYTNKAIEMMQNVLPYLEQDISYYSHWASLLLKMTFPRFEVVICGHKALAYTAEILREPLVNVLIQQSEIESELPLLKHRFTKNETYVYVCQNKVCYSPDDNVDEALKRLKNLREKSEDNISIPLFLNNATKPKRN